MAGMNQKMPYSTCELKISDDDGNGAFLNKLQIVKKKTIQTW